MTTRQTISPREHDEAEAALYFGLAKAERQLAIELEKVHHEARDRRDYRLRARPWGLRDEDALRRTPPLARAGYETASAEVYRIGQEIADMEAIYRQHNWTRYFPCLNADGHIHASLRGCSTVRFDTAMAWTPGLSGKTVAEAIAELGPTLCSVCFPDAPAEHCQKRSDIERVEREAVKLARQEAKFVKRLREGEQFCNHHGWRVETVAACKEALRQEVEFRFYYGRGPHCDHPASVEAAKKAAKVLLAREARQAGTGATQEEIDTIIARAEKKHRKLAEQS